MPQLTCDKIICVGKNYLDHAKELGDAVPEKPVFFIKPPSCSVQATSAQDVLEVALPKGRGSIHHECELVLRIGPRFEIEAVTLGLDMTLRDVQAELKKKGHPWEVAKVFSGSALLGPWIAADSFPSFLETEFSLWIDGVLKQRGVGSQMRTPARACITEAAQHFPLCAGDVFFTGTPAGVGPVAAGELAELKWGEKVILRVKWN